MTPRAPAKSDYAALLGEIKSRIQAAQIRSVLAVNSELVRLYWEVGQILDKRRRAEGWGTRIIPRLARDLLNAFPEVKGFSERNLDRMIAFYREYRTEWQISPTAVAKSEPRAISPQAVAKLRKSREKGQKSTISVGGPTQDILRATPWAHHLILMAKVKDRTIRHWYMVQIQRHGWSGNVLQMQIETQAHLRQGRTVNNFSRSLPAHASDFVQQTLKDPYVFDFLTLEKPFHERELEIDLVRHIEKFLLELGQGFAFLGRQYHLTVGEEDFYIDLLFYHVRLRSYVVIELKSGAFKPEYAGKLNFYCSAVDGKLRQPEDRPTIGLLLCRTKNDVLAEYALRGIDKPIGIASFALTRKLPPKLKSALPSIEEIEKELAGLAASPAKRRR